jgi:hypothetical protein
VEPLLPDNGWPVTQHGWYTHACSHTVSTKHVRGRQCLQTIVRPPGPHRLTQPRPSAEERRRMIARLLPRNTLRRRLRRETTSTRRSTSTSSTSGDVSRSQPVTRRPTGERLIGNRPRAGVQHPPVGVATAAARPGGQRVQGLPPLRPRPARPLRRLGRY